VWRVQYLTGLVGQQRVYEACCALDPLRPSSVLGAVLRAEVPLLPLHQNAGGAAKTARAGTAAAMEAVGTVSRSITGRLNPAQRSTAP